MDPAPQGCTNLPVVRNDGVCEGAGTGSARKRGAPVRSCSKERPYFYLPNWLSQGRRVGGCVSVSVIYVQINTLVMGTYVCVQELK